MSNFPPNDSDQVNRPGPYSPSNYGGTSQPGPFNSRYGAPAPGQYQPQPLDPKQQQMQEFINYKFSPEELRVIKQCEIDSLVKRSFPIGLGLGLGTFWGIQKGILKTGRYGAWPKIIGASVLGYIIGRFSYMKTCQERIMELPNSRLGQMLRIRSRKYNPSLTEESYATDAGFATALTLAPLQTDDFSQPSSLNLDTDRPYDDAGDHYVPTREGTNDLNEDLNIPTHKNFISYDELRQKNRDDFQKSHRFAPGPSYGRPPAPPPVTANFEAPANVPIASVQSTPRDPAEYERHPFAENDRRRANLRTSPVYGNKNQYGDTWTE